MEWRKQNMQFMAALTLQPITLTSQSIRVDGAVDQKIKLVINTIVTSTIKKKYPNFLMKHFHIPVMLDAFRTLFFKGSSYNPFRLKADRKNRAKQSKRARERSVFHLPEAFQFCGPRSDINRSSFCRSSPSSWVPPNDPGVTAEERRSPVQHLGGAGPHPCSSTSSAYH